MTYNEPATDTYTFTPSIVRWVSQFQSVMNELHHAATDTYTFTPGIVRWVSQFQSVMNELHHAAFHIHTHYHRVSTFIYTTPQTPLPPPSTSVN